MSDGIVVAARAKINLGLRILKKRRDGFHEIQGIFQTVGLCDFLRAEPLSEKNVCLASFGGGQIKNNTVNAAYDACRKVLKRDLPAVKVFVEKNIPQGAGLGGGSSDAAALIFALKKMGVLISKGDAKKIAAIVGSDVFFFLECEEKADFAAVVEGRGERVFPIRARSDFSALLVLPDVCSKTAEAYALLDGERERFRPNKKNGAFPKKDSKRHIEKIYRRPAKDWNFSNDFTPCVAKKYREVWDALCAVKGTGPSYCEMSGSGSAVFGVYESKEACENAARSLSDKWKTVSL